MTQQRLNNLFLLYVHTARTDALDLSSMVKAFVSANICLSNYFWEVLELLNFCHGYKVSACRLNKCLLNYSSHLVY